MINTFAHIFGVVILLLLVFSAGWKEARNYYTNMTDEEWDEIDRIQGKNTDHGAADDGGPNFH